MVDGCYWQVGLVWFNYINTLYIVTSLFLEVYRSSAHNIRKKKSQTCYENILIISTCQLSRDVKLLIVSIEKFNVCKPLLVHALMVYATIVNWFLDIQSWFLICFNFFNCVLDWNVWWLKYFLEEWYPPTLFWKSKYFSTHVLKYFWWKIPPPPQQKIKKEFCRFLYYPLFSW